MSFFFGNRKSSGSWCYLYIFLFPFVHANTEWGKTNVSVQISLRIVQFRHGICTLATFLTGGRRHSLDPRVISARQKQFCMRERVTRTIIFIGLRKLKARVFFVFFCPNFKQPRLRKVLGSYDLRSNGFKVISNKTIALCYYSVVN